MRRFGRLAAGVSLLAVLLSGCGRATVPKEILEPALAVSDEGQVTAYLVEEFNKAYYDLTELEAMAQEEVDRFSEGIGAGNIPVALESVKAAEDGSPRVVVTYRFTDTKTYREFIEQINREFIGNDLFYGTVAEALAQGYGQGVTLQSVSDGASMTGEELSKETEKHLIITDAAVVIYCPNKVTHVSSGAVLREDGSIDASQTNGLIYILLAK